jgi:hypothetical protein
VALIRHRASSSSSTMSEHPYRDPAAPDAPARKRVRASAIALAVLWIAALARVVALVVDHSLAGPFAGLSIALALGIPVIALNARVLAGD